MTSSLEAASAPGAAKSFGDLFAYDVMGLAELIRTKVITPKEVIEDTIRKIEAINPTLNAVICKTYDRARQAASGGLGAKSRQFAVAATRRRLHQSYRP
jgi:Asp-tRNA(Asn)/Glu-tRNA(Gln) amidotransferase A subunit family amidase